jgi:hypothetical protein
MEMSAFSFNSHPSEEAGWHKHPDTAWDSKKKQCNVLRIGGGMAKCIGGCYEVLLLMGIRGKKYGTSRVYNRVIKARMGYSAGNRLPLGGFRFLRGICIPGTIFLGNWPKISWPEKVQLRCRDGAHSMRGSVLMHGVTNESREVGRNMWHWM